MPAPPSRLTLFQNPWLEKLTVISVRGFIAVWAVLLPAIAWAAWRGGGAASPLAIAGLILAGAILWTLTEYGLHRFVFHWVAASARTAKLVFILHGNHHNVPNDPLRNLMPPIVSLPIAATIWAGLAAAFGPPGHWIFLGFMAGYVAYDLVHYACHQWPMRGRLARALKTHHMRHHHGRQDGNYAITGMMWDRLLRTRIPPRRVRA